MLGKVAMGRSAGRKGQKKVDPVLILQVLSSFKPGQCFFTPEAHRELVRSFSACYQPQG